MPFLFFFNLAVCHFYGCTDNRVTSVCIYHCWTLLQHINHPMNNLNNDLLDATWFQLVGQTVPAGLGVAWRSWLGGGHGEKRCFAGRLSSPSCQKLQLVFCLLSQFNSLTPLAWVRSGQNHRLSIEKKFTKHSYFLSNWTKWRLEFTVTRCHILRYKVILGDCTGWCTLVNLATHYLKVFHIMTMNSPHCVEQFDSVF